MQSGKLLVTISMVVLTSVLLSSRYWTSSAVVQTFAMSGSDPPKTTYLKDEVDTRQSIASQHNSATANLTTSGSTTGEQPKKLSSEVIEGIKTLVFFVGYARSGHSIIASLMDAHPHVIITNHCSLFKTFNQNEVTMLMWRDKFFNLLYKKSAADADEKTKTRKGYSLKVEGLWQGTYDGYIEAIGSKCGGATVGTYFKDKTGFIKYYKVLKEMVRQIRIIHAVRNPFDIIATKLLVLKTNYSVFSNSTAYNTTRRWSGIEKMKIEDDLVQKTIDTQFHEFETVIEMIEDVFGKEIIFEVHNIDLVSDPRETILKLFKFLEVDTTEHYLDVSSAKIFKSVSRSRDGVMWTPKQRDMIENKMKKFPMLKRYSFTSD